MAVKHITEHPIPARIAVIVHVFYAELWPELANCIRNIDDPYDLFVTVRPDGAGDAVCSEIAKDFPHAALSRPENVGYDIWPFLSVVNSIDLSKYSIVVKLHTKRNVADSCRINYQNVGGSGWRRRLLSFLSSSESWLSAKRKLAGENVGMVADGLLILNDKTTPKLGKASNMQAIELANRLFNAQLTHPLAYVAGSMFMVRAELLRPLQGVWNCRDFIKADTEHTESFAHVVERLFGLCVIMSPKRIVSYKWPMLYYRFRLWAFRYLGHCRDYLYQRKIRHNGSTEIKVFRLPIYCSRKKPSSSHSMAGCTANSLASILQFHVHGNYAGSLVALEKGADFPFEIKRVYYIWGTAPHVVRGHHAHKNLEQVVVCTSGSCDFILDDGTKRETYHLDSPTQGLHIKNNVWREFTNFSPDCVVMVLASEHYNEADYIRDYGEFLRSIGK